MIQYKKLVWTIAFAGVIVSSLSGCVSSPSTSSMSETNQASLTDSQSAASMTSAASSGQSLTIQCEAVNPDDRLSITDDLNRTVELKRPERIAVLIGSFADELVNAGGQELIVAAAHDSWSQFDLDLQEASDLGDVKNISFESLLAAKPDLVIASAKNESQKNMKETLDEAGIPVVYFDVDSFEDYLRTLNIMTMITGDCQAYEENGLAQQKAIEEIQNKQPDREVKVLALRETGKGIKALGSENSLLGQMLADLHTNNIAGEGGLDTLSMETIQIENPDAIFYVAQGKDNETAQKMADELFSQEAWQNLDAVKNERVYVLDQKLYNLKPNAKWAQALADLGTLVYGE